MKSTYNFEPGAYESPMKAGLFNSAGTCYLNSAIFCSECRGCVCWFGRSPGDGFAMAPRSFTPDERYPAHGPEGCMGVYCTSFGTSVERTHGVRDTVLASPACGGSATGGKSKQGSDVEGWILCGGIQGDCEVCV